MARTTRHQIRVSSEIAVTPDVVWKRISEHEATPTWVDEVTRVTLTREGSPRNGLGAIRVVEFKPLLWSTIHEEITLFEPGRAFEYVLFKGMPSLRSHLGQLSIDDLGSGRSRLHWDVDFEFSVAHPFRLFLASFLRDFEGVLGRGVDELKRHLESESG